MHRNLLVTLGLLLSGWLFIESIQLLVAQEKSTPSASEPTDSNQPDPDQPDPKPSSPEEPAKQPQPMARGIVFHDKNQNGRKDSGEPGVSQVKVSNGTEIVLTDQQGRYALPVSGDMILFVIKPRDWMSPVNSVQLPQFYYIHKPNGSPDQKFRFAGSEATGPLPESIDFPLLPTTDPQQFDVLLVADPQIANQQQLHWYSQDVAKDWIDTKAKFGIVLGDHVENDLTLFAPFNQVQALSGIPWYHVLGNHDLNLMAPDDASSDETFERVYGPANYLFQVGQVHFIVLDNVFWKGYTGSYKGGVPASDNYEGRLSESQLGLVKNYLALIPKTDRIVLATSLPLHNPWSKKHGTPECSQLLKLLSEFPHLLAICGHAHLNHHHFLDAKHGYNNAQGNQVHHYMIGAASGSWYRGPVDQFGVPFMPMADGTPNGFAIASFSGTDYSLQYHPAGCSDDFQAMIHLPDELTSQQTETTQALVNVFQGGPNTQVRYRLRGASKWAVMKPAAQPDPVYLRLRKFDEAHPVAGRKPLPKATICTHLWSAPLPANIQPGTYLFEVEAKSNWHPTVQAHRILHIK